MYCYYQGEMKVTEGTEECLLEDVVATVKSTFENYGVCAYKDFNDPEIIIVDFSDSCYVSEKEIRFFVEKAKSFGWKVNAKIPHYGDYEGWMVITDNEIEEYSTDEMAVMEYLESNEVKKAKEIAENAVSTSVYLFLWEIFGKEGYPRSVIENLEWVANELAEESPSELLLSCLRKEIREGDYNLDNHIYVINILLESVFKLNREEVSKVVNILKKAKEDDNGQ